MDPHSEGLGFDSHSDIYKFSAQNVFTSAKCNTLGKWSIPGACPLWLRAALNCRSPLLIIVLVTSLMSGATESVLWVLPAQKWISGLYAVSRSRNGHNWPFPVTIRNPATYFQIFVKRWKVCSFPDFKHRVRKAKHIRIFRA